MGLSHVGARTLVLAPFVFWTPAAHGATASGVCCSPRACMRSAATTTQLQSTGRDTVVKQLGCPGVDASTHTSGRVAGLH